MLICYRPLEAIKETLGIPPLIEVPGLGQGLRVWDAVEGVAVVWEDATRRLKSAEGNR